MNEYTIVIPTLWKSPRIHKLLEDLIKCASVAEIILIDNSSEFYNHYTELEKVRVIQPGENIYVNPAWNLGVREAKHNSIALVSDDTNFDPMIFDALGESQLKTLGIIGMHGDNFNSTGFEEQPQIQLLRGDRPWGWGCLLIFHKSYWLPIPEDIKVWYGDDFIITVNPSRKYVLHNYIIDTEMSTTVDEPQFTTRKGMDGNNWIKLIRTLGK